jgi:DNA-binding winged helix-turn-helix (wHTH) protein
VPGSESRPPPHDRRLIAACGPPRSERTPPPPEQRHDQDSGEIGRDVPEFHVPAGHPLRRLHPDAETETGAQDLKPRPSRQIQERWTLDIAARALIAPDASAVELTAGEFDLLAALARRPQQIMSRDDIMDVLKGRQADAFDRSIDIQMSRLRRKLGDDPRSPTLIRTVRNAGYLFAADVEEQS